MLGHAPEAAVGKQERIVGVTACAAGSLSHDAHNAKEIANTGRVRKGANDGEVVERARAK